MKHPLTLLAALLLLLAVLSTAAPLAQQEHQQELGDGSRSGIISSNPRNNLLNRLRSWGSRPSITEAPPVEVRVELRTSHMFARQFHLPLDADDVD